MSYIDPETGETVQGLKRVRYTHEAMIDLLISQPMISQNQIASHFGYTPAWVSVMMNSDTFQARYALRTKEVVDPALIRTIEERFKAVAQLSLDRVIEKLASPLVNDTFALDAAKLASSALGYGARPQGVGPGQGTSVVINMPGVAASASEWAARHRSTSPAIIEEQQPIEATEIIDHEVPAIAVNRRS